MENFTDSEFLTAHEKAAIYKTWCRFIDRLYDGDNEGAKKAFSKRLYNHLHLHCGYIAHCDQNGFWHTYFEGYVDVKGFFEHSWLEEIKYWMVGYMDINQAMQEYAAPKIPGIFELQDSIEKTEDITTVRRLVKKYKLSAEAAGVEKKRTAADVIADDKKYRKEHGIKNDNDMYLHLKAGENHE